MSQRSDRIRVGISIGDIAGIGPEVIIKCFLDERMYKICTPVVFGSSKVFGYYRKHLDIQKFQYTTVSSIQQLNNNVLNIVPAWEEEINFEPGQPNEITGNCAMRSLDKACQALQAGDIDVLVTAPLNKHAVELGSPGFKGHTEYLQEYLGASDSLMFMVSDPIKVGLVTNHIPVSEVSGALTAEKICKKIRLMYNSLVQDFGIEHPKIAVLALNPHGGDQGTIGKEDMEIVKPAIDQCADELISIFGPYSADAFFARFEYKMVDGIIAMYHDQGLIPFKALAGTGCNYTAGLPVVRTSPDHGTAEDIAGKNLADPEPFRHAIFAAMDIFRERMRYRENNANPVKHHVQKLER